MCCFTHIYNLLCTTLEMNVLFMYIYDFHCTCLEINVLFLYVSVIHALFANIHIWLCTRITDLMCYFPYIYNMLPTHLWPCCDVLCAGVEAEPVLVDSPAPRRKAVEPEQLPHGHDPGPRRGGGHPGTHPLQGHLLPHLGGTLLVSSLSRAKGLGAREFCCWWLQTHHSTGVKCEIVKGLVIKIM